MATTNMDIVSHPYSVLACLGSLYFLLVSENEKQLEYCLKYAPEIQEQTSTALLAITKAISSGASNSGRNFGLVL
jgi:hypothetical protein